VLNLSHPQTEYIFQAAVLLDGVRKELLALESAKGSAETIGRTEAISLVILPKLHTLNREHFKNSPEIEKGLESLAKAVGVMNLEEAWVWLLELEGQPGKDNFGVWAI
jgi:hypothetical protein